MSDRPCDLLLPDGTACDYVAVDDPGEYASGPGARLSNHKNKVHGPKDSRVENPMPTEPAVDNTINEPEGTGPFAGAVASDEVPPSPGAGSGSAGAPSAPRAGGFIDRWRQSRRAKAAKPEVVKPGRATGEKTPGGGRQRGYPRGGRVPAAKDLGDLWGFAGGQLQRIGHVPTGRMIRFQGPVAGELLDDVLNGTLVDKMVVQRAVQARGKIDALVAIFGPPLLTFRLEQAIAAGAPPEALENLQYLLKETIRNSIPTMLPAVKKVRKRAAVENAAMAEMLELEDLEALGIAIDPKGQPVDSEGRAVDVADVFVNMLFAEWEPPPVTVQQPQPEENAI